MGYLEIIAEKISKIVGMEPAGLIKLIEIPPNKSMGDYAFPCFKLSRTLRQAPNTIADNLAKALAGADDFAKIENIGGYLNFFADKEKLSRLAIEPIRALGDKYGASQEGKGKVICIDYSSINIAKRFHIGHLSTTMIGSALYKIYEFLGYRCVGINHLGDWGTQFGKMIAGYLKWGNKQEVEEKGIDELVRLYVMADKDETMQEEGKAWFKKIEDGDATALEIFNWFKEITLRDAERIYDLLGVKFDSYAGESFYNDKMQRVIDELTQKGLLVSSDGARVVELTEYNMPPCLILKNDGATLYATRDIAAALYRKGTYNFYKTLYVVAYQQDLHFRQLFKVLELMGYDWAKTGLEHVAFGMVSYEGKVLSTRKGHIVYLEDVLNRAVEKALNIINEKSPDLPDKERVAKSVGIGSVVFYTLLNNRIKDIDFWWDRVLNFDGETGPYTQYTHARCCSVLAKAAGIDLSGEVDYAALDDEEAQACVSLLASFPDIVADACHRNEPSVITRFTVDLAQAYNHFYYERRIIGEAPAVEKARLVLTDAVRTVLKNGLSLIGVDAPTRM